MSVTPQYTHDCDSCHFLGRYNHNDTHSDLYFCPSCDEGTVIARYSSNGPSYSSYPLDVIKNNEISNPHISQARKRTIQRGLYTPTIITTNSSHLTP